MSASASTLLSLDDDALGEVLARLPLRDAAHVARTCRRCARAAACELLWQRRALDALGVDDDSDTRVTRATEPPLPQAARLARVLSQRARRGLAAQQQQQQQQQQQASSVGSCATVGALLSDAASSSGSDSDADDADETASSGADDERWCDGADELDLAADSVAAADAAAAAAPTAAARAAEIEFDRAACSAPPPSYASWAEFCRAVHQWHAAPEHKLVLNDATWEGYGRGALAHNALPFTTKWLRSMLVTDDAQLVCGLNNGRVRRCKDVLALADDAPSVPLASQWSGATEGEVHAACLPHWSDFDEFHSAIWSMASHGHRLAVGSDYGDHAIRVFDARSGDEIWLDCLSHRVGVLAMTATAERVLSLSANGTLVESAWTNGESLATHSVSASGTVVKMLLHDANAAALDSALLFGATNGTVSLYDRSSRRSTAIARCCGAIHDLARVGADNSAAFVAVGEFAGMYMIDTRATPGRAAQPYSFLGVSPRAQCDAVATSRDGRHIVCGADSDALVFDARRLDVPLSRFGVGARVRTLACIGPHSLVVGTDEDVALVSFA